MARKAQAAIEYLMVFGLALLLSTPFVLKAQQSIFDLKSGSDVIGLQNSLDNTASAIETVSASGEPARRTFFVEIPESVESGRIVNDSIVYTVATSAGNSQLVRTFDIDLFGEVPENPGRQEITVYMNDSGAVIELVD